MIMNHLEEILSLACRPSGFVDESDAAPARLATCKARTACRPVWCHLNGDEMPPPPPQMKPPSEPVGQILSLKADHLCGSAITRLGVLLY